MLDLRAGLHYFLCGFSFDFELSFEEKLNQKSCKFCELKATIPFGTLIKVKSFTEICLKP